MRKIQTSIHHENQLNKYRLLKKELKKEVKKDSSSGNLSIRKPKTLIQNNICTPM